MNELRPTDLSDMKKEEFVFIGADLNVHFRTLEGWYFAHVDHVLSSPFFASDFKASLKDSLLQIEKTNNPEFVRVKKGKPTTNMYDGEYLYKEDVMAKRMKRSDFHELKGMNGPTNDDDGYLVKHRHGEIWLKEEEFYSNYELKEYITRDAEVVCDDDSKHICSGVWTLTLRESHRLLELFKSDDPRYYVGKERIPLFKVEDIFNNNNGTITYVVVETPNWDN